MEPIDRAAPIPEKPGIADNVLPRPISKPSNGESVRASRLLPGRNCGMYRMKPLTKRKADMTGRLKSIAVIRFQKSSIRITGNAMVMRKREFIKLSTSRGRLRFFFGIRASFLARAILVS